jgi:predicted cupin superfamily sugar epimerase
MALMQDGSFVLMWNLVAQNEGGLWAEGFRKEARGNSGVEKTT